MKQNKKVLDKMVQKGIITNEEASIGISDDRYKMYISGVDEIKGVETIEETLEVRLKQLKVNVNSDNQEKEIKSQIRKLKKLYEKKQKEQLKVVDIKQEVIKYKQKKAGTQKDEVLRHLKDEGSITSWDAFKEYGITRLSAIIYKLRHDDGMDILASNITKTNRYGNIVNFAKYTINENKNT